MKYPIHRKGRIHALFLICVLFCGSAAGAVAPEADPTQRATAADSLSGMGEQAYVIGPQNVLQIKIMGEAGIGQIYRVDDLGFITHPLVGRVRLAGETVAAAEQSMEIFLREGYILNPQVTIFVLEHSRFSILGEINRPGTYEILGQVSLIEAISMAGGFTPVADQGRVKILRKDKLGERNFTVDASRIARGEGSGPQQYVNIQADDVIVVPKSFF